MQMEGLIPFKSSIDQAIISLYFLRISNSCCSLGLINAADIITSFAFSSSKKAYFNCLGNSFKVNPLEIFFFFCLLFIVADFSVLFSFKHKTVSFKSKLEF